MSEEEQSPSRDEPLTLLCLAGQESLREALAGQVAAAEHGMPAGISIIVDGDRRLLGTVTDGDVRRHLANGGSLDTPVAEVMNAEPISFAAGLSRDEILAELPGELERRGRRSRSFLGKIVLTDEAGRVTGVVDYHELLGVKPGGHRVVVVGLGYVGLTVALALADEDFDVVGVDVSAEVVEKLGRGVAHIYELGVQEVLERTIGRTFAVTTEVPVDGDVFIISVGTPIDPPSDGDHRIRLDHLEASLEAVGARLRRGGLVVLRSTVPIGTCRGPARTVLEQVSGLQAGRDFHLAFAPERTIEGRALKELRILPQVIGGLTAESVDATAALFRELSPTIVRAESLEAAELVKLVNNSYRDLTFAFANQVSQVASRWNFDAVAAIRAANQGYPREQIPLPSPGVGGPCLTKDPFLFATSFPRSEHTLMHVAREVNESMHEFVVVELMAALEAAGKDAAAAQVFVAGLAFKGEPETDDLRSSSPLAIVELLRERVGTVLVHDPVVDKARLEELGLHVADLPPATSGVDALLVLTNHRSFERLDIHAIVQSMADHPVVYDAWHQLEPEEVLDAAGASYCGLGFRRTSLRRS
jgi:nucleotide sugar dehydrogenase